MKLFYCVAELSPTCVIRLFTVQPNEQKAKKFTESKIFNTDFFTTINVYHVNQVDGYKVKLEKEEDDI